MKDAKEFLWSYGLLLAIFFVVAFTFVVNGFEDYRKHEKLLADYRCVTLGSIIALDTVDQGDGNRVKLLVMRITYAVDSNQYSGTKSISEDYGGDLGEKLKIYYDCADPKQFEVIGFVYHKQKTIVHAAVFATGMFLIVLVFCVVTHKKSETSE